MQNEEPLPLPLPSPARSRWGNLPTDLQNEIFTFGNLAAVRNLGATSREESSLGARHTRSQWKMRCAAFGATADALKDGVDWMQCANVDSANMLTNQGDGWLQVLIDLLNRTQYRWSMYRDQKAKEEQLVRPQLVAQAGRERLHVWLEQKANGSFVMASKYPVLPNVPSLFANVRSVSSVAQDLRDMWDKQPTLAFLRLGLATRVRAGSPNLLHDRDLDPSLPTRVFVSPQLHVQSKSAAARLPLGKNDWSVALTFPIYQDNDVVVEQRMWHGAATNPGTLKTMASHDYHWDTVHLSAPWPARNQSKRRDRADELYAPGSEVPLLHLPGTFSALHPDYPHRERTATKQRLEEEEEEEDEDEEDQGSTGRRRGPKRKRDQEDEEDDRSASLRQRTRGGSGR